jgi:hypothetical protein
LKEGHFSVKDLMDIGKSTCIALGVYSIMNGKTTESPKVNKYIESAN